MMLKLLSRRFQSIKSLGHLSSPNDVITTKIDLENVTAASIHFSGVK